MGDNHYNIVGNAGKIVQMGSNTANIDLTGDDIRVTGGEPLADVPAIIAELCRRAAAAASPERAAGLRDAIQVIQEAAAGQ